MKSLIIANPVEPVNGKMNGLCPPYDSPVCPCWWVIKGRQQKVLPPFPIIEERGIFHD